MFVRRRMNNSKANWCTFLVGLILGCIPAMPVVAQQPQIAPRAETASISVDPESPVENSTVGQTRRVLIVVGPSSHPPETHEVMAGARVIQFALRQAEGIADYDVEIHEGWPSDSEKLENLATIVFSGDRFPLAEMENTEKNMAELAELMNAGCGIVCFHYATGLTAGQVPDDGAHPLLDWLGGYFATRCKHHQSIARIFEEATIEPAAEHPVMQGVEAFTIHDEPYINNYFGPDGMASNVTALATSMLPPEMPKREIVAWAVERDDGGRGMGVVMPHFYRNWNVEPLRKMILNGVVWTSHSEVPESGVSVELPSLEDFR
jgi:type 1 glutamine amidotransferase